MTPLKLRSACVASVAFLSLSLTTDTSAATAPDSLQLEIDKVLANTEGGVQISRNEIAWNGGEAIMAFPLPGETHAPPSSPAAQKLQAKVAGVPFNQKAIPAEIEGAAASEPVPSDETEPTVTPLASDACPTEVFGNDWYCFYQYKNYGGRRLQWNASHKWPNPVYFSAYDFVNRTSSWSNKGGKTIYVAGRIHAGSDMSCYNTLWEEPGHSRAASLSSALDNKADCFWTS
ncbi:hypothetical protein DMH25_20995 [Streptomyces sp. WAC 01325]|nr:hypothetical protein DMH25_20995 [Streptomyces sp. WAC 01325]